MDNIKFTFGDKIATVDILGTRYDVVIDVDPEEMPEDSDGCTDQSVHMIKVAKLETGRNTLANMNEYRNKILRHEITHAFMYESGLWNNCHGTDCWAMDETITDWFAIQSPKIYDVFKEVDCL